MTTPPEDPVITIAALAKYVQADAALDKDYLEMCIEEADALVQHMITGATVPEGIVRRAVMEAASDLFMRKNTRTGVPQFDTEYGVPAPFPVLRDPKNSAIVILRPWLTPAIG